VIVEFDIRSVIDVGCGDWQWAELMDWTKVNYIGIDVVSSLIERNTRKHGSPRVQFRCIDATRQPLPAAELVVAKDVLQHWPNRDVQRFLRDSLRRCRYALLTNDVSSDHWSGEVNQDIEMGAWRTLDLTKPPFDAVPIRGWDYDVEGGEWVKRVYLLEGSIRR
jgi:SAM-dependent methyltransferase